MTGGDWGTVTVAVDLAGVVYACLCVCVRVELFCSKHDFDTKLCKKNKKQKKLCTRRKILFLFHSTGYLVKFSYCAVHVLFFGTSMFSTFVFHFFFGNRKNYKQKHFAKKPYTNISSNYENTKLKCYGWTSENVW